MNPNTPERVREVRQQLEAAGVQYCFATYVDVHGVPKAKAVPLTSFEKMCSGSELFTVGAMDGMGLIGPEKDECAAVPDLDSLTILPWDKRYAWFASDLWYHGEPYANCSRVILKKALAKAKQAGYGMNLGVETEFYVFRPGEDGPVPLPERQFKGPCPAYDVNQTMQSMSFLDRMVQAMNALGWSVYSFDAEGGSGQYELDFAYADALTMCDRLVFFRFMAKAIAQELGLIASFMPKPYAGDFRSGAHFNMSLYDSESGDNLFAGDGSAMAEKYGIPFPDLGYHFVSGLLAHASALTAVTCPSFNSYKGLLAQGQMADMSWAPVLRAYGKNNRSAMLRLPMNRPCVENRAPDISCNFYLGTAMSLMAGLEGIAQAADPGEPMNDNLYLRRGKPTASDVFQTQDGTVRRLPRTLLEALQAFETDPIALATFGEEMRDIYLSWKLGEWERDYYIVDAPERERMLEAI
ncbi:glutamine synthetase [Methyloligella sp. 2.7D]|uniref:glutamine synthetase n=1 Tax=unclassified Methyloligella TaxID=2625955 RepID=UPI00157E0553|nr:glutamine synthetase [Methyloligella sp. GL2]QKP77238.1 glutamine synthetase [Methyloligella sp. GL2]